MVVVITSGRAHKAELLVKILLKHGIEPVYLPVLKVEEVGVDAASFVSQIEGFHVFIFMTGQSAFSLANLAKSAGVYDQLRERLKAMEAYCRGSKAAGNVKTHFGVECKATCETSDELLQAAGPRLAGRKVAVSFYGVVDTEYLEELRKTAAEVAYVQTYHSEETDNAKAVADLVLKGECSLVVFTSGVAVDAFFNSLDEGLRAKVAEALNKGVLQTEGVQVFFLEDLDLYVVSHFDGELYRLGFVDLRTRVGLKVRCDRLEEEAAVATELKDIPWERLQLKVFTLYPLNCFEGGAEGALALKINIEPHWLMYDWVKIARAILSSWSEHYVRWLRERFGPVDAVKIVGPGA